MALIIHDSIFLLIPKEGHAISAFIVWVIFEVDLMQILGLEEVIFSGAFVEIIWWAWELPPRPSLVIAFWVWLYDRETDDRLETLNLTNEVGTMSKGTEESDVEVITVLFGLELGV
jgi:hypothetical protein